MNLFSMRSDAFCSTLVQTPWEEVYLRQWSSHRWKLPASLDLFFLLWVELHQNQQIGAQLVVPLSQLFLCLTVQVSRFQLLTANMWNYESFCIKTWILDSGKIRCILKHPSSFVSWFWTNSVRWVVTVGWLWLWEKINKSKRKIRDYSMGVVIFNGILEWEILG